MPGPFHIEVEGMKELLATFKTIEESMLDFRQLGTWKAVAHEFRKIQKEIFDSGGAKSAGGTWQQLTAKYLAVKNKKYGGPTRTLIASGEMYKEFTTDAGNVTETAQEMTFSFSQPAGYHMSKAARSKMPYRSSLDLTEEQEKQLVKPVQDKLKQLIANARLRQLRGQ